MAHIEIFMNAIGLVFSPEICTGCGREFERGERMAGVKSESGEPMGWYCDECIQDWKDKGENSKVFEK